jgi:hypothetical protein
MILGVDISYFGIPPLLVISQKVLQNLALSKHEPISDGGLGMVKPHSWVLGMVEPEILDDHVHPLPENRSWAAQTPQSRRTASLVPRPKVPAPPPWAPS